MNRVIHFEIHAEQPQRAIDFYAKVFGWKFDHWAGPQDYWLITTGSAEQRGIDGGLVERRGVIDGTAVTAYVCTIQSNAVDKAVADVISNGGENVVPKMGIPGVGWLVYCKDTEGNIFGIMQDDPNAK